jgi:hypothetical protein
VDVEPAESRSGPAPVGVADRRQVTPDLAHGRVERLAACGPHDRPVGTSRRPHHHCAVAEVTAEQLVRPLELVEVEKIGRSAQ